MPRFLRILILLFEYTSPSMQLCGCEDTEREGFCLLSSERIGVEGKGGVL